ncbi:hypothetical protein TPHV1_140024 [Treponema phagedenis]|uniref:Uncharacterized protein n=1 Tax=Treponema phagedenis TaxID=162 RepID=A0A0B7GWR8_TREPH|nr:hypothetical protein TPHV1_140024 [Treponema phagedenis]
MDAKSEPPRMAVVLNRIEFENYHSYINRSFQTHRFHFATDGKTQYCHGWQWFHAVATF